MTSKTGWKALESNPESINPFLEKIGIRGVECVDVYSFEEEMLEFIPSPQLALILCFPSKECKPLLKQKFEIAEKSGEKPKDIFFMNQHNIGNACGTFALFHSLANLENRVDIGKGKFAKWLEKARLVKESERCDLLREDSDLANAHREAAEAGETDIHDVVDYHYLTYVNKNGFLYEIDGVAPFPRLLGKTSDETLIKDASVAVKELMDSIHLVSFSALALIGIGQ